MNFKLYAVMIALVLGALFTFPEDTLAVPNIGSSRTFYSSPSLALETECGGWVSPCTGPEDYYFYGLWSPYWETFTWSCEL